LRSIRRTQHLVCRELSTAAKRLLLQRRRPGQRALEDTDAGKTWTKLTGSGLPPGTYGRIALDVSRSNPNVVYVQIEAGATGARLRHAGGSEARQKPRRRAQRR
jgi:hypothetical protein